MAVKLRRAEERFIPQFTRAASFKRLLGRATLRILILGPSQHYRAVWLLDGSPAALRFELRFEPLDVLLRIHRWIRVN